MAFPCPRCGDRYTQSLPMVYGTGTSVRNWRSRSGYRGNTVSQSIVGNLASPPAKRSVAKPLFGLLILCFFLASIFSFQSASQSTRLVGARAGATTLAGSTGARLGRHRANAALTPSLPAQQQRALLLVPALLAVCLVAWFLWRIVRAVRFNASVYPELLRDWQLSFMCKGCGTVFLAPDVHALAMRR